MVRHRNVRYIGNLERRDARIHLTCPPDALPSSRPALVQGFRVDLAPLSDPPRRGNRRANANANVGVSREGFGTVPDGTDTGLLAELIGIAS